MYDLFLDNAGTKPSLGEGRLQQPVQKMSQQFRAQGMVHHSKGIANTIFHVIWTGSSVTNSGYFQEYSENVTTYIHKADFSLSF